MAKEKLKKRAPVNRIYKGEWNTFFKSPNVLMKIPAEPLPKIYEKPVFIKEKELTFPKEIIEKFNGGRFCVQCSGCHGCR